jgi:hypothetical protein
MNLRQVVIGSTLLVCGPCFLIAADSLESLHGHCTIRAEEYANRASLNLEHGDCSGHDCGTQNMDLPWSVLSGFALTDLAREGAKADTVVNGEAGRLTCSGTVHDQRLSGDYTFVPDRSFVARMDRAGYHGLDSDKLLAYTLFQITMSWIESLQQAGVTGMDANNLIALKIFKADAAFVRQLGELGYPTPPAEKLIALRVQGVDPAEVKQIRALGLDPSLDELIQMRIFKVTPDFVKRMQARGFNNLSISKLVQIRIFNLAE